MVALGSVVAQGTGFVIVMGLVVLSLPGAIAGPGDPISGVLVGLGNKSKAACNGAGQDIVNETPFGPGDPIKGVLVGLKTQACGFVPTTDFALGQVVDEVCSFGANRVNDFPPFEGFEFVEAQDCVHVYASTFLVLGPPLYITTQGGCTLVWQESNGDPGFQTGPGGDSEVLGGPTVQEGCNILRQSLRADCLLVASQIGSANPNTGTDLVDHAFGHAGGLAQTVACDGGDQTLGFVYNDAFN